MVPGCICKLTTVTHCYKLQRIEPYAIASAVITNGHSELKSTSSGNLSLQADNNIKSSMGRLSISQSSEPNSKETKQVACRFPVFFYISFV